MWQLTTKQGVKLGIKKTSLQIEGENDIENKVQHFLKGEKCKVKSKIGCAGECVELTIKNKQPVSD